MKKGKDQKMAGYIRASGMAARGGRMVSNRPNRAESWAISHTNEQEMVGAFYARQDQGLHMHTAHFLEAGSWMAVGGTRSHMIIWPQCFQNWTWHGVSH
jgi:hypothetical protein